MGILANFYTLVSWSGDQKQYLNVDHQAVRCLLPVIA